VKVRRDWSGVHVEDLGSRNGIKINKKRNPKKTLQDRDEVEVGGVRLLFLDPNEVREAPVVLPDKSDDEGESTQMNKDEDVPPPEPEAPAEPPPEEPPPQTQEDPPPEEQPAEGDPNDAVATEDPQPDDVQEGGEGEGEGEQRGGVDLSNRSTLIGLAIAGVVTLVAVVFVILLLVGA
jgi:hypothetical protein